MKSEVVYIENDFDLAVKKAVSLFENGNIFIYPTDTIYGFGGNPFNETVVKRIAQIKERELNKLFILLINNLENLINYVEIERKNNIDFLRDLLPASITFILNLNEKNRKLLKQKTGAFRIPDDKFCKALLDKIEMPLISTSVNKSNQPALNDSEKIITNFGNYVDAIFVSEKPRNNRASTIIDFTGKKPELVREGSITFKEILDKFNRVK